MNPRRQLKIALLGALCAFLTFMFAAAPAEAASSSNPVIADCLAHPGGLVGHYTAQQLHHALAVMPAETKQYTSCPDVINRALLAVISGAKGGGGTGGGSGSFLPTPVIIVLVVLVLGAVTFGAVAIRRRQGPGGADRGDGSGTPADA